jgi:hypothetical protein
MEVSWFKWLLKDPQVFSFFNHERYHEQIKAEG